MHSTKKTRPAHTRMAAVALVATLAAVARMASAQTTQIPDTSGDQLIFLYDARTDRVPFLFVSNPSDDAVTIELAFYPANLSGRIADEVRVLGPAANTVIDPTQIAGVQGNGGLAVVTPVQSQADRQAIVPPQPLTGGFTLANVALGSAFGSNPVARMAVTESGDPASPGASVDGTSVRYERFTPEVLTIPVYFDPASLGPAANDGNRVLLATFEDQYGGQFNLAPRSDSVEMTFISRDGFLLANTSGTVDGVLLSDLQSLAGAVNLNGQSGKVFFAVDPGSGSFFGLFAQSVGTFAGGQLMPAVAFVPDALPAPSGTPIVVPTPTGGTPSPSGEGCTVTISITYDAANVPDLSGLLVELGYPSSVSIPGFGGEQLVLDRVANLTGLGSGLFNVSDQDENAADLHVNIGLVSIGQSIPSGPYASVRFDCSSAPPAAAFSCTVAGSDTLGLDISPDLLTCSLAAAS